MSCILSRTKCHLCSNHGLAENYGHQSTIYVFLIFEKCLSWPAYWTRLAPCQMDCEVLGCAVTLHNIMVVRLFTRWINLLQIQSSGAMFFPPLFTCRMSHRGAWRRGGRSWLGRRKTTPSGCIHGLIKSNAWCKRKSIQVGLQRNWTCDWDPPCHKTSWRVSRSRILSCAPANLQVVLPAKWTKLVFGS